MMKGSKRFAVSEPNLADTNETAVSVTVNTIAASVVLELQLNSNLIQFYFGTLASLFLTCFS